MRGPQERSWGPLALSVRRRGVHGARCCGRAGRSVTTALAWRFSGWHRHGPSLVDPAVRSRPARRGTGYSVVPGVRPRPDTGEATGRSPALDVHAHLMSRHRGMPGSPCERAFDARESEQGSRPGRAAPVCSASCDRHQGLPRWSLHGVADRRRGARPGQPLGDLPRDASPERQDHRVASGVQRLRTATPVTVPAGSGPAGPRDVGPFSPGRWTCGPCREAELRLSSGFGPPGSTRTAGMPCSSTRHLIVCRVG